MKSKCYAGRIEPWISGGSTEIHHHVSNLIPTPALTEATSDGAHSPENPEKITEEVLAP